jgi:hypothetical protein
MYEVLHVQMQIFLSVHIRSPEAQEGLRARGLTSIGWEKYPNLILPPAFFLRLLTRR